MLIKILILLLYVFFINLNSQWAKQILNKLTLEQKIAQLFVIGVDNSDFIEIQNIPDNIANRIINSNKKDKFNKKLAEELIKKYNIGGIHLIGYGSIKSCFESINYFQSISKIPLLISQDFEWGLNMRLYDAIDFPKNKVLGVIKDNNLIYLMAKEIGRQCKLLGVHINFAPVIDVNNNPNNRVIAERSFGDDKYNVALKGISYIKGLQDAGIIACAKHFCGHGDTDIDSHYNLPIINHTLERINDIELYPFKEVIKSGVMAIMSAHIHVPSIDSRINMPITLSKNAMTNLLQNKLNFKGLIITDALDMESITKYYQSGEAELEAFLAGNDILLMSLDVSKSISQIKNAILKNPGLAEELNKKVLKILNVKEKLGLHRKKIIEDFDYQRFHTDEAIQLKRKLYEAHNNLI